MADVKVSVEVQGTQEVIDQLKDIGKTASRVGEDVKKVGEISGPTAGGADAIKQIQATGAEMKRVGDDIKKQSEEIATAVTKTGEEAEKVVTKARTSISHLLEVQGKQNESTKQMVGAWDVWIARAGVLGKSLAAVSVTLGIIGIKMGLNGMNEAAGLKTLAQQTNISVENLSRLKYVAEIMNVPFATLTSSMAGLQKSLTFRNKKTDFALYMMRLEAEALLKLNPAQQIEAIATASQNIRPVQATQLADSIKEVFETGKILKRHHGPIAMIEQLGLKMTDLKKMKSDEMLKSISDALGEMGETGANSQIGLLGILFGGGKELVPMFQQGGDAIREAAKELDALGGVVTTDTANNADAFANNLTRIGTAFAGVRKEVTKELSANFVSLTNAWVGMLKNNGGLSALAVILTTLAKALLFVVKILTTVVRAIIGVGNDISSAFRAIYDAFKALGKMDFAGAVAAIARGLAEIQKNGMEFNRDFKLLWEFDTKGMDEAIKGMEEKLGKLQKQANLTKDSFSAMYAAINGRSSGGGSEVAGLTDAASRKGGDQGWGFYRVGAQQQRDDSEAYYEQLQEFEEREQGNQQQQGKKKKNANDNVVTRGGDAIQEASRRIKALGGTLKQMGDFAELDDAGKSLQSVASGLTSLGVAAAEFGNAKNIGDIGQAIKSLSTTIGKDSEYLGELAMGLEKVGTAAIGIGQATQALKSIKDVVPMVSAGIQLLLPALAPLMAHPIIAGILGAMVVGTAVYAYWDDITAGLTKGMEAIRNWVDKVTEQVDKLWDKIKGVADKLVEPFKKIGQKMFDAGAEIISKLAEGIKARIADIVASFTSLSDKLPAWIKDMLGAGRASGASFQGSNGGGEFIKTLMSGANRPPPTVSDSERDAAAEAAQIPVIRPPTEAEWGELMSEVRGFTEDFSRETAQMLVGTEKDWKSYFQKIGQYFAEIVINRFIARPLEDMMTKMMNSMEASSGGGGFGGILSSIGGAIGGMIGGGGGGSSQTPDGIAAVFKDNASRVGGGQVKTIELARGGQLPAGYTGVVGEEAPEIISPSAFNRRVTPMNNLRTGGKEISFNPTYNFATGVTKEELASIIPQIRNSTIAAFLDAQRRGAF